MNKLSPEILLVNKFAYGLYQSNSKEKNEKLVNFLISLDFLVKGLFTHWMIKVLSSEKSRAKKVVDNLL
jgi:hypothetical protein